MARKVAVTAALVSLAVFAVGFGMWRYWWTALDHHPEQDACSFGPVTNADYRQMLARVKALQAEGKGHWGSLSGPTRTPRDIAPHQARSSPLQLMARMNEFSAGTSSLYEQRMIMHAVMRAAGGYLNEASSGLNDFSRSPNDGIPKQFINAVYAFHSNYRGDGGTSLAPFAIFVVWLQGQQSALEAERLSQHGLPWREITNRFAAVGLDVSVFSVRPNAAGVSIFHMPRAETCLPELDPRIAQLYGDWVREQRQP